MSWAEKWLVLSGLLFSFFKSGHTGAMFILLENTVPRQTIAAAHTALSGDLTIIILELPSLNPTDTSASNSKTKKGEPSSKSSGSESGSNHFNWLQEPLILRVLRLDESTSELIGEVSVKTPLMVSKNVSITAPCGFFTRGGTYSLQIYHKSQEYIVPSDVQHLPDIPITTTIDVKWPTPSLTLQPQHFDTYPSQPILGILEYKGLSCLPSKDIPAIAYSLHLIYCGLSVTSCDPKHNFHRQILRTENVREISAQRIVTLSCHLFGLPGYYALRLEPIDDKTGAPTTSTYIKIQWSDQFLLKVHARSIYPCGRVYDGYSGIPVMFTYPSCRLSGDRIRVHGRLKADVASLASPSTLHYVAEMKAPLGKNMLTFDCDVFTERFVEYCFAYVSEAVTGAMAEVRVNCVPTFSLKDKDVGDWGLWSQWTPCSSSCAGGMRTRHRFCDAPPPKYGGKFCQGEPVETESCGGSSKMDLQAIWNPSNWECRHGDGLAVDKPEIKTIIDRKCQCGCFMSLSDLNTIKIVAASTRTCHSRSLWLIKAIENYNIRLQLVQTRVNCKNQYIRVRDGNSLSAELLADVSVDKTTPATGTAFSSGPNLLLEFFTDDTYKITNRCTSGFLAHIGMLPEPVAKNESKLSIADLLNSDIKRGRAWTLYLTPVHLITAALLVLIFFTTVLLMTQFVAKYWKLNVADDLTALSNSLLGLSRLNHSQSSSTLTSQVISLVELSHHNSSTHLRCNEMSDGIKSDFESEKPKIQPEVHVVGPICRELRKVWKAKGKKGNASSSGTSVKKSNSTGTHSSKTRQRRQLYEDRRNRKLHGSESDFSLANVEVDLELDYYDYNVVNASAIPGSYFGVEPSFVSWIPPLPSEVKVEGVALTPAEYKILTSNGKNRNDPVNSLPPSKRQLNEVILEYNEKLMRGVLPIHPESENSSEGENKSALSNTSRDAHCDIILNKLGKEAVYFKDRSDYLREEAASSTDLRGNQTIETDSDSHSWPISTEARRATKNWPLEGVPKRAKILVNLNLREEIRLRSIEKKNDLDTPNARHRALRDLNRDFYEPKAKPQGTGLAKLRNLNVLRRYSQEFNDDDSKISQKIVNIPLSEFPKNREPLADVHNVPRATNQCELPSTIEAPCPDDKTDDKS